MNKPIAAFMLLLVVGCSAGCVRRDRLNAECAWTHDPATALDAHQSSARRHLIADVTAAEELAIRFADARRGLRSGRFEGHDAYASTRERCLGTLISAIATTHDVSEDHVRAHVGERLDDIDLAIALPFVALYWYIASRIAGWMVRSLPSPRRWLISTLVVLIASVAVSAAGVLSGELWFGLVESLRLGTTHMSYRAEQLPWRQHRAALFIAGTATFVTFAYRARRDVGTGTGAYHPNVLIHVR